jgi:cyanophycinase
MRKHPARTFHGPLEYSPNIIFLHTTKLVVLIAVALLARATPLLAQQQTPYRYFRTGAPKDVRAVTKPGFALMGGGKDLDEAFRWMCIRSGGGDFLVLRATGTDDYNPYIQKTCKVNSVATLIVPSRKAAADPFVIAAIRDAAAIFIAGGDQADYVRIWKGTPLQNVLNGAIHRGAPIGGTSAGMAVLGEFIYSAQNDMPQRPDLSSQAALTDPYTRQLVIAHGFLDIRALQNTITDTHFVSRNRMGRLLTFMARTYGDQGRSSIRGIGVDEQTAFLAGPDGHGKVVGAGAVYFLFAPTRPTVLKAGRPLGFYNISAQKVVAGGSFDLKTWTGGEGTTHYFLNVDAGTIRSSQTGNSIY